LRTSKGCSAMTIARAPLSSLSRKSKDFKLIASDVQRRHDIRMVMLDYIKPVVSQCTIAAMVIATRFLRS